MSVTDLIPWRRREKSVPVRRETEHHLQAWQPDMERLFDELFSGFGLAPVTAFEGWDVFSPRVDVVENDKEIKVSAELPGTDEKDIEVALSQDVLTIRGEKKEEAEDKGKNYYRLERSYGSFQRSIPLPCEVNTAKVEATFKNGVLTIVLPKTGARECKKIAVKTGQGKAA